MFLKKLFVIFVCWTVLSPNAYAQFGMWSGSSWMVVCEHYGEKGNIGDNMCKLYTQGVIEGWHYGYGQAKYDALGLNGEENTPFFCLSRDHSTKQHVLVIKQFLKEHPPLLNLPASFLIAQAMKKAFPCTEEGKK